MRLHVSLNGVIVGQLSKDKNAGLHFVYDKAWLNLPGARPISLSLPLAGEKYSGDKVYNFFDNLPDTFPGYIAEAIFQGLQGRKRMACF